MDHKLHGEMEQHDETQVPVEHNQPSQAGPGLIFGHERNQGRIYNLTAVFRALTSINLSLGGIYATLDVEGSGHFWQYLQPVHAARGE